MSLTISGAPVIRGGNLTYPVLIIGVAARQERLRKSRLLIGLFMAVLLVLYPFQTETIPTWTVQFVDEVDAPALTGFSILEPLPALVMCR